MGFDDRMNEINSFLLGARIYVSFSHMNLQFTV